MTALVAHPLAVLGRVAAEAPSGSGELQRVEVERWSTDVLGCEAWAVRTIGGHGALAERWWVTTPELAVAIAQRRFQVAGYGLPPFGAAQLHRSPIAARGTTTADLVRGWR